MLTNDDRPGVPPAGAFRVVGIFPDGTRELCAAAIGKELAETVAALERKIRNYSEVVVEPDVDPASGGRHSREWN